MDHHDYGGPSDDLRCKRSDGKQWRCSALSMPDKTVCEKHYIQAKRRAANSAKRANERKAQRRKSLEEGDAYLGSRTADHEVSRLSPSPGNAGTGEFAVSAASLSKHKEKVGKGHRALYAPGRGFSGGPGRSVEDVQRDRIRGDGSQARSLYSTPSSGKGARNFSGSTPGDYSGRSSGSSGEADGLTCHHCRRNDPGNVVWCSTCDQRGYCLSCISRWYADVTLEDLRRVCPACRGTCTCKACSRDGNLIKAKAQEMAPFDKLRYLHTVLQFALPMLKQIYNEECSEISLETRAYGPKVDIPRAKINPDEQMCCDFCKIPILDFHRHCTRCSYDLCLTCCRDIRGGSSVAIRGESVEGFTSEKSKDAPMAALLESSEGSATGELSINFDLLFPNWKAEADGSIACAPLEAGGCGSSKLVLRRIFKINWVAKLVKGAEEMVNGCIVRDMRNSDGCTSCTVSGASESDGLSKLNVLQCSKRDCSSDNFSYLPASLDIKHQGIDHFHKHWVKGEPFVVQNSLGWHLAPNLDPSSICKGIQEIVDERMDDNIMVKAVDCLTHSEVDVKLGQFIKGYSEGIKNEDGTPEILKLKDWPPPGVLEEFLLCQQPELLVNFPLIEFIHSKWGILNLAAKLPHDTLQNEVGPKLVITYGTHKEHNQGDSVTNLQINMTDMVCLLIHQADANHSLNKHGFEKRETSHKGFEVKRSPEDSYLVDHHTHLHEHAKSSDVKSSDQKVNEFASGSAFEDSAMECEPGTGSEIGAPATKELSSSHKDKHDHCSPEKNTIAAIWDVFRCQDVSKLNAFIRTHWQDMSPASPSSDLPLHPLYSQDICLSKDQKEILKEKFEIEPWTFEQHLGEAVFVPAGCPFQVRNVRSSVQLALEFLSPESLGMSSHMAKEIRCLSNDHDAKLNMLEVGKMSLYAASSAIREIQKIALDPKLSSDIKFEDPNLTAMVSENLERVSKRRQVVCS